LQNDIATCRFRSGLLLVAATALLAACHNSSQKSSPEAEDVLVRVGSEVVRIDDIEGQFARMSGSVRSRYAKPEERRAFFDKLVQNEILAAEARKLGYDRDPDISMALKKAMVQKLLKERLGEGPKPSEITEEEIQDYYRRHLREFQHPEEVRVAEIFVRTKERALAVLRDAARNNFPGRRMAAAPAVLEESVFRKLVLTYSEDEDSKSRGGELTFVAGSRSDPEALASAAFALEKVGDLSPLVETPRGFHILQLTGRVPARNRTLEESRGRIVRALTEEGRDRKLDELVAQIAKGMSVEVFEDRFAQVRIDTAEPTGMQAMPISVSAKR
jgi:peptidyl-prolyl cis-trans isomerase C